MIYEDFNRPKVARILENVSFKLTKKNHSLGLMQVQTENYINDLASVKLGIEKVKNAYQKALKKNKLDNLKQEGFNSHRSYHYEWKIQHSILKDYNPDRSYIFEVSQLSNDIFEKFYSESKDYLTPFYKEEKYSYDKIYEEE